MKQSQDLSQESAENAWEDEGSRRLSNHLMEERKVSIKLEGGSLIRGKINILAEPANENHNIYIKHGEQYGAFFKRISDVFTKGKNLFIVVFDATAEGQPGRVLIINKNKILWISPED